MGAAPEGPSDVTLSGLRSLAVGVAYRMVGSRTEAEDLAQEALARVAPALAAGEVRNAEAFTTTVTTRLAIDHLRLARVQREAYVGPWLPEPVIDERFGPAAAAELGDSLSFAFLVVLESLAPLERAAFLLREVFSFDYPQVAEALGRSEAACRQLVSRARSHIADRRPRFTVDPVEHRALLDRFVAAATTGDVDGLRSLLTDDVVLVSDGGPDRRAARHPIDGIDRVVRFVARLGPKLFGSAPAVPAWSGEVDVRIGPVNGEPGFVVRREGEVVHAGTIEIADGAITSIWWVVNPDKLHWVDADHP
jgi:RNA polymerase sigma-70 factor (ECF subfamily)